MNSNHYIIEPARVMLEEGLFSGCGIEIKDGRIHAVKAADAFDPAIPVFQYQAKGEILLPGFIDLHIHGSCKDADTESLSVISDALLRQGVTGFLATTMTAPEADISAAAANVANYKRQQSKDFDNLLGLHLEGPFISPDKAGAQHPDHIQKADLKTFQKWRELSNHLIKQVTLAPEMANAPHFIEHLNAYVPVVSAGHSNATCAQAQAGFKRGINHCTHLFNASSGVCHRNPGLATAVLLDPEVSAELIPDGVHLKEEIVELAVKTLGKERIVLITDAIRAQGVEKSQVNLGGQQVFIQGNQARLANGQLAGSILKMNQAIAHMSRIPGVNFEQAIKMATLNPAKKIKMDHLIGSIAAGKQADMVLMDSNFNIEQTIIKGNIR
jgi:N-acetylglucosamine-6-phosphate deacetylase